MNVQARHESTVAERVREPARRREPARARARRPVPTGPRRAGASPVARRPAGCRPTHGRPVAVRPVAPALSRAVPRWSSAAVTALVVLAAAAVVLAWGVLASSVRAAGVPDRLTQVQVGAEESLWQIARRSAPSADPAAVVSRVMRVNGLESSGVQPGQMLLIPIE